MSDPVPIADQVAEVERELDVRAKAFPHFVARGSKSQAAADREMARMRAALATLKWVERNQDRLRELASELRNEPKAEEPQG